MTRVYYDILLLNSQRVYMQPLCVQDTRALIFNSGGKWVKTRNILTWTA